MSTKTFVEPGRRRNHYALLPAGRRARANAYPRFKIMSAGLEGLLG
jgi:hypothetical protein